MGTRSEFLLQYGACAIPLPTEYKLQNKIQNPHTFCVDCVFLQDNRGGERCDEFVFFDLATNRVGIYLVERKTDTINVSHIVKQLQGGAQHIEYFRKSHSFIKEQFDFMPMLVSKRKARSALRAWKKKLIVLGDKERRVRHIYRKEKLPYIGK